MIFAVEEPRIMRMRNTGIVFDAISLGPCDSFDLIIKFPEHPSLLESSGTSSCKDTVYSWEFFRV